MIPEHVPWEAEWLESDGLGGFASGTVGGVRSRRYHGLLLCATTPPTGRVMLVNGLEASLETGSGRFALSAQHYAPDVVSPDGQRRLVRFRSDPWPRWTFRTECGMQVEHELLMAPGLSEIVLRWRLDSASAKGNPARLYVRPLLSGRDYHGLHHHNGAFNFEPEAAGAVHTWWPYAGLPGVAAFSNGMYRHDPLWYDHFLYAQERRRGLDAEEDLAAPGVFSFDLLQREAVLVLRAVSAGASRPGWRGRADAYAARVVNREAKRRAALAGPLARRAEQYIVRRAQGRSLVAGYPWFADWGRDTFIALRGLCLANADLAAAGEILLTWADMVSEGMLPNRFPDVGDEPEYNSVDASLWYIIAVHDFLRAAEGRARCVPGKVRRRLHEAVAAILAGYAAGTRYGIHVDRDGLLAAGEPGVQLTWMDAKVGDWVVTPRIGKPVEVQALWLNALHIAGRTAPEWERLCELGLASFRSRFWREEAGCLFDVVDADHVPGRCDPAFRPNQIFAVGGLPMALLPAHQAARLVAAVEARLLTPLGLRSLAQDEPGYRGRYEGGVWERDGAYHQGTVWPWLLGAFTEAWLRVRGATPDTLAEARSRFLQPLLAHLGQAGLGHVSELADGDPPHAPRGCPFQAWSLGELLRMRSLLHGDVAAYAVAEQP